MNTRLQVEHPVTELVTGVDLVADQIRVAAGEPLPYRQGHIRVRGWAIECRIAAEDPFNDFLPSTGKVSFVSEPGGPGVRVDSALYNGVDISYPYDPLIAKLCTWVRNRQEAIQRMPRALLEFKIVGVSTNIPFHLQVMNNSHFMAGRLDTAFLEKHFRLDRHDPLKDEKIALVAAAALTYHRRREAPKAAPPAAPRNPNAWRSQGRPNGARGRIAWRNDT